MCRIHVLFFAFLIISSCKNNYCAEKGLKEACDPLCLPSIRGFSCACEGIDIRCIPSEDDIQRDFGQEVCTIFNHFIMSACQYVYADFLGLDYIINKINYYYN